VQVVQASAQSVFGFYALPPIATPIMPDGMVELLNYKKWNIMSKISKLANDD
jgi:hypothetical protein